VLYAFTGLLLFVTFRKYMHGDPIVPFVASLLFIAHPIHTEAVANIKSRDEIMSLLFLLGAMNLIYEWIRTERFGWMLGAVISFFLSLLSKESGITFLAVFPLAVYFFTDTPLRKNIIIVIWMLVPVVIYLIIRHHVLAATAKVSISELDNVLASAPNGMVKLATAIFILGLYLKILFFPHPLVIDYSYKQIPLIDMSDWRFMFSLVIYATLVLVAVLGLKKRHFVSFGILYFLITMSIFSNILVLIGTSFGERFMLIPSVGFCLVLAFFGAKVFPSATKDFASIGELFRANGKLIGVCSALVVLYGFKTIQRNKDWKDNYTLFAHDVKIATQSAHMHKYYCDVLSGPDQFEGKDSAVVASTVETAIVELKKAIEIFPKYADCYNRLGLIYYKKKIYKEALDNYNLAIQYNNSNAVFYNNIGTLFFETHDYENAMKALRRAVELDPHYADALLNLAGIYGTLKDYDNALVYLQRCIKEDPNYAKAYYFLSITYGFKGDKDNHDFYMSKYREMTGKNTL